VGSSPSASGTKPLIVRPARLTVGDDQLSEAAAAAPVRDARKRAIRALFGIDAVLASAIGVHRERQIVAAEEMHRRNVRHDGFESAHEG
jgi:hypothetical protein